MADEDEWDLSLAYGPQAPAKDITLYWNAQQLLSESGLAESHVVRRAFSPWSREVSLELGAHGGRTSLEENVLVRGCGANEGEGPADVRTTARCCICSCYRRSSFSATLRTDAALRSARQATTPRSWELTAASGDTILTEPGAISRTLWKTIEHAHRSLPPTGLVVVAGGTCSGKSSLARCLALKVIRDRCPSLQNVGYASPLEGNAPHADDSRLPHLITCEDPIETWELGEIAPSGGLTKICLTRDASDSSAFEQALRFGFCFTPRELTKDVGSIQEAIDNALRQTPACLYIGEIRRDEDWKHVLRFSGTGHLVIVTTHAQSLVELLHRLLTVGNATSPAKRRELSARLLAAVHVRLEACGKGCKVSLPAVWANVGAAANALVGEGLASVVPNGQWVFNRSQMLLQHWRSAFSESQQSRLGDMFTLAQRAAHRLDIEDLRTP